MVSASDEQAEDDMQRAEAEAEHRVCGCRAAGTNARRSEGDEQRAHDADADAWCSAMVTVLAESTAQP